MTPETAPSAELAAAIDETGSFEEFQAAFTAVATTRFGSDGHGWLLAKKVNLKNFNCKPRHTNLRREEPILGLDVWEHAYYVKYRNVCPDHQSFLQWLTGTKWRAICNS